MKRLLVLLGLVSSLSLLGQRDGRASLAVGSSLGIYSTETEFKGLTSINASLTWSKLKGGVMMTYFSDRSLITSYNIDFNIFDRRPVRYVGNTLSIGAGDRDFMIGVGLHAHAFNLFAYVRQNYKKENGSWGFILQYNITHQSGRKNFR